MSKMDDPQTREHLLELRRGGMPTIQACRLVQVPRSTFYEWKKGERITQQAFSAEWDALAVEAVVSHIQHVRAAGGKGFQVVEEEESYKVDKKTGERTLIGVKKKTKDIAPDWRASWKLIEMALAIGEEAGEEPAEELPGFTDQELERMSPEGLTAAYEDAVKRALR